MTIILIYVTLSNEQITDACTFLIRVEPLLLLSFLLIFQLRETKRQFRKRNSKEKIEGQKEISYLVRFVIDCLEYSLGYFSLPSLRDS